MAVEDAIYAVRLRKNNYFADKKKTGLTFLRCFLFAFAGGLLHINDRNSNIKKKVLKVFENNNMILKKKNCVEVKK